MPVFSIREIWNGRLGGINERGIRKYRRIFLVQTDSMLDGALGATNTPLLPLLFSSYVSPNGELDIGATCRGIDPVQTDDPFWWIVTYNYSSERSQRHFRDNPLTSHHGGTMEGDMTEQNPLLRAAEVKWSTAKYQLAIETDNGGNAIVLSNGVRPDPPIEIDDSRSVLTITKNVATDPSSLAQSFRDKLNTTNWIFGIQANTAKCSSLDGDSQIEQGQFFWRVTGVFEIRREGWSRKLLNAGTHELVNNTLKTIFDKTTGLPVSAPVPLDANGMHLDPPYNFTYSTFSQLYDSADFNTLPLYP